MKIILIVVQLCYNNVTVWGIVRFFTDLERKSRKSGRELWPVLTFQNPLFYKGKTKLFYGNPEKTDVQMQVANSNFAFCILHFAFFRIYPKEKGGETI